MQRFFHISIVLQKPKQKAENIGKSLRTAKNSRKWLEFGGNMLGRELEKAADKAFNLSRTLRDLEDKVSKLEALLEAKIETYRLQGVELIVFRTNDERALRVSHELLIRTTGDCVMTAVLRPGETLKTLKRR